MIAHFLYANNKKSRPAGRDFQKIFLIFHAHNNRNLPLAVPGSGDGVVPDFTPVTFPLPFTVATELSATDQVTAVVMPCTFSV